MAGELQDSQGRGAIVRGLPSIHPDGRRFGLAALGLSALCAVFAWETLAWPLLFLGVCIFAIFRDPPRVVPQNPQFILSPADGIVAEIVTTPPPAELVVEDGSAGGGLAPEPVVRVGIATGVFDVHVNRAPVAGLIRRVVYVPGTFAGFGRSREQGETERQHLLIEQADGARIGLTQIAGSLARRIAAFVKPGDAIGAGQRFGLMRLGSRVELYLPSGTGSRVILGQRVTAGETIIAERGTETVCEGVLH